MSTESKIPDAETRAKSIAGLKAAGRLLDLWTLELDEAIAALDNHLIEQRRTRLSSRSNSLSTPKTDS